MIKYRSLVKRSLLNRIEHMLFLFSHRRKSLFNEFSKCTTQEEYFHFADSYIGIRQNPEEFLSFISYAAKRNPRVICEIGVREGGTNFMLANALGT